MNVRHGITTVTGKWVCAQTQLAHTRAVAKKASTETDSPVKVYPQKQIIFLNYTQDFLSMFYKILFHTVEYIGFYLFILILLNAAYADQLSIQHS